MMKAAVVRKPGADPTWADFDEPVLDKEHRLAYLVGAGIHPVVRSMVDGCHYGSAAVWPAIPGIDAVARTAAGEVIYTGWITAPWGTMVERMAVPARFGIPVPDNGRSVSRRRRPQSRDGFLASTDPPTSGR